MGNFQEASRIIFKVWSFGQSGKFHEGHIKLGNSVEGNFEFEIFHGIQRKHLQDISLQI